MLGHDGIGRAVPQQLQAFALVVFTESSHPRNVGESFQRQILRRAVQAVYGERNVSARRLQIGNRNLLRANTRRRVGDREEASRCFEVRRVTSCDGRAVADGANESACTDTTECTVSREERITKRVSASNRCANVDDLANTRPVLLEKLER